MTSKNRIQSAIEIYEKVFQTKNSEYSKIETWQRRKLYNIYIIEDLAFLAVEKREKNFHIWLMGSLEKGFGTQLFQMFINDIKELDFEEITVSTFPNTWKIMYSWLKKIGFKEFKVEGEKCYLKVEKSVFISYFKL